MTALTSELGERPTARCKVLGAVPYSEDPDFLSRPYLTQSHRATIETVRSWMIAAGMGVRLDPLGNLIGRYEGTRPDAPALLIGSHIDTVRNGGCYDGALGVMVGIECVEVLSGAGRRLPFAVEVIAFGDEEGSRFAASMLCSRGIAEGLDKAALDLKDANGVTLRQALTDFGLDPSAQDEAIRKSGDVFAYLETHIEQGPVLESLDLALGIVTGIVAQLRLKARFVGVAGHAGTSPMGLRKDAMAAAAAAILAVEEVCAAGPEDLRGTVGRLLTKTSAYNVIVGEAEIGIDLRASDRATRDAAAAQIRARLDVIAQSRGVEMEFCVVQDLAEAPCDPRLVRLITDAVQAVGVAPVQLPSGAGHDAMSVKALCPVAMLFIRCEGGISHNPREAVAADDVGLAVQAMVQFMDRLALEEDLLGA